MVTETTQLTAGIESNRLLIWHPDTHKWVQAWEFLNEEWPKKFKRQQRFEMAAGVFHASGYEYLKGNNKSLTIGIPLLQALGYTLIFDGDEEQ